MYVCICNAIRETELRDAARRCKGSVEDIYIALGRPPQCRQCLEEAEEIIDEENSGSGLALYAAA
ncbi:(2Fe-2S)-binding protein [Novosphingobium malaysiense]|uniref:Ferredoxin n=1 Tax=Novosphingobium malaysiense TaxID=1348853 RepID=A0A0B1ZV46_9SPHN|nr:(2Fe-2S)-binding protein [Novosphingobium malaysiense]KHK93033.1 ferredoxin [Novosphingobium malaysiense]